MVRPRSGRRTRKHRLLWAGVVLLLLLTLVSVSVVRRLSRDDNGLAGEAVVTASSTAFGFSPRDVVTSGSADAPGASWQSSGETAGAWIQLDWHQTHQLRKVVLVRNPVEEPGITEGYLSFGDGSYVQVRLSETSRETVVPISPRAVGRLRFTASEVSAGAHNVTIAEMVVSAKPGDDDVLVDDARDGNESPSASASLIGDASASDPHAVQDGSGAPGTAGIGADWTVRTPLDAGLQLAWSRPRELSSVQLVGGGRSGATVARATLTFADGSQLPVGAVLSDPAHPTTVSFLPRVTTSLRLTIDQVTGSGSLSLGELRAYRSGATPVQTVSDAPSGSPTPASGTCSPFSTSRPASGLIVRCPETGAIVGDRADVDVAAAAGYTEVTATVWPAEAADPAGVPVRTALDPSGAADITANLAGLPPGPLTVQLEATGPGRAASTAFFQLYRGGGTGVDVASSSAATGRTLTFHEEFNRPVTLSRTGIGADFAGAKPTDSGAQDFGDAIFPDDASGFRNVQVVDNRYLRMSIEPTSAGYVDPSGGGRTHVGGLLASSRQGGSGFSAQYGYFEARMLVPAAPGTWPAFWMLPSDNLVAPTPVVAEIDAVELYGHEPTGACESTHEYENGKDGGVARCGQRFATTRAALAWHTYGVSILPTDIVFYIDGKTVATAPQVQGGAAPMFFLLDLALGGGWPVNLQAVQDRADLYVDYVRVYV